MALKDKIKLINDGEKFYYDSTGEGKIQVSRVSCQCMSWKSMRLPCRHILAARMNAELDLFSESLCDKRWLVDYYKLQQRVFVVEDEDSSEADVSVVTFSSPKKKVLSQVCILVCTYMTMYI